MDPDSFTFESLPDSVPEQLPEPFIPYPVQRMPIPQTRQIHKKTKWTNEEDRMLIESVRANGMNNWSIVAQMVPGRSGKQCRERWTNQLSPNLSKDSWSPQEDQILIEQQKIHGNLWAKMTTSLPGRSANAIKNRFSWLSRHGSQQVANTVISPYAMRSPQQTAPPDAFSPSFGVPSIGAVSQPAMGYFYSSFSPQSFDAHTDTSPQEIDTGFEFDDIDLLHDENDISGFFV